MPTRIDRPEDIQTNPVNGRVYAAMTNNSRRTTGPDEANPLTQSWAYDTDEADLGSYAQRPGNRNGHVFEWIETDGTALSIVNEREGTVGGSNDGLFAVPTAGPERGHLRPFLTVPVGAECSGPQITPDGRSVFVAAQHPGETDGSTLESPSSTWPDTLAGMTCRCPRARPES